MNTDSYFEIGYTHDVCEDYAIAGTLKNGVGFAIVCDGCSNSRNVDVGARILAICAAQVLHSMAEYRKPEGFTADPIKDFSKVLASETIGKAKCIIEQMSLPIYVLDSTLVVALMFGSISRIFIYGDGGFIATDENGKVSYTFVNFDSSAPYYLTYTLDPERNKRYNNDFGDKEVWLKSLYLPSDANLDEQTPLEDWEEKTILSGKDDSLDSDFYFNTFFEIPANRRVSVVSDGVHTYSVPLQTDTVDFGTDLSRMELHDIDYRRIIRECSALKGTQGAFIKRRMKRFQLNCKNNHIFHADDVSIASIVMG